MYEQASFSYGINRWTWQATLDSPSVEDKRKLQVNFGDAADLKKSSTSWHVEAPMLANISYTLTSAGFLQSTAITSCNIHDAVQPAEPRIDLTVDIWWSYCLSTPCECWIRQCKSMLMLQMSSWHSLLASQPRISCDRCAAKCRFLDKHEWTWKNIWK